MSAPNVFLGPISRHDNVYRLHASVVTTEGSTRDDLDYVSRRPAGRCRSVLNVETGGETASIRSALRQVTLEREKQTQLALPNRGFQ